MATEEPDMETGSVQDDEESIIDDYSVENLKEFRQKRQCYREIINEINENENEAVVFSEETLLRSKDQLNKINNLFDGVKRMREMAYDSHAVDLFTSRECLIIENLQTNLIQFFVPQFYEKLSSYIGANRLENEGSDSENEVDIHKDCWFILGRNCSKFFKKSPPFHFMYGSFETHEVEVKKRIQKPRDVRDKNALKVNPVEVSKLGTGDRDKTTEQVENVLALLNSLYEENCDPVCYFRFCIDPSSFAMTVENMFYIAFLIKDGAATISLDDDHLPVITPITRGETGRKETKDTKQIVMSVDLTEYQNIIDALDIKKAIIKRHK